MNVQADRLAAAPPHAAGAIVPAVLGAIGAGLFVGLLAADPLPVFAVMLVLVVAFTALARQQVVIALVVFVVFSNAAVVAVNSQGLPSVVAAAVPLMLAIPLADGLLGGRRAVTDRTLLVLVALLFAMTISGALAREPEVAQKELATFAVEGLLLYFLVLNALRREEALRLALWTVLAAGAFLAAVTILQALTKTFEKPYFGFSGLDIPFLIGQSTEWRAQGPVSDPNYYAQLLLPALAIGLVAMLRERIRWLRILAGAMSAAILLAIMFTGSRGAAVALAAMLVVLVALRLVGPRQLLGAGAALAVALALNPTYAERLSSFSLSGAAAPAGTTASADTSTRSRLTENLAAAQVFADHPLVGVGPGGFPLYYEDYANRIGIEVHERRRAGAESGVASQREAHNIVLGVAADLGFVGLALFVSAIWLSVGALVRARRRWLAEQRTQLADLSAALLVGLTGYLVAGLFLSLAFDRYLWLLLGIAGAASVLSTASGHARR